MFGQPQTSNLLAQADASNPNLIGSIQTSINNILGLSGQAVQDEYTAEAQGYEQQGYQQEAGSYGAATEISDQNAALAQASAAITGYQKKVQAGQQIGTMIADRAANGFGNAGTPLQMLRSSLMQSALTQQLTQTQGNITSGGFLEQAAASTAEEEAAQTAANAAAVTGEAAQTGGEIASASASQEASLLSQQLKTMLGPAINNTQNYTGLPPFPGIGSYISEADKANATGTISGSTQNLSNIVQTSLSYLPNTLQQPIANNLSSSETGVAGAYSSLASLFDVASLPNEIVTDGIPIGI